MKLPTDSQNSLLYPDAPVLKKNKTITLLNTIAFVGIGIICIGAVYHLNHAIFDDYDNQEKNRSPKFSRKLRALSTCSETYTFFDKTGFCYKTTIPPVTFTDADNACIKDGAHLVSIHSAEEADFLVSLHMSSLTEHRKTHPLDGSGSFWTGLVKTNGKWKWNDGGEVDYEKWASKRLERVENNRGDFLCQEKAFSDANEYWERAYTCKKALPKVENKGGSASSAAASASGSSAAAAAASSGSSGSSAAAAAASGGSAASSAAAASSGGSAVSCSASAANGVASSSCSG